MSDNDLDQLTSHNYDGIQEYDNPTPAWWTWIFVVTVIFSVLYFFIVHTAGGALSPEAYYERDYVAAVKANYGQLGDVKPDAATISKLSHDADWVKVGESLFQSNCVSCHGADGSGISAPNLTDNSYLHVRKIEDIADVVANGRKNGAMPAWKNRLQPVEQVLVSSYVASLRGKNLQSVGHRAAEGEQIAPWDPK
jgi:cytochrome c oxidase cbb3-type subunit 3